MLRGSDFLCRRKLRSTGRRSAVGRSVDGRPVRWSADGWSVRWSADGWPVRWSPDGQWIYFQWLPAGSDWRDQLRPYRVRAQAGAKLERVTEAHMDSIGPALAGAIIAVADTARGLEPMTVGILPGQDVLTLPSMAAKLEAQLRGMGIGYLPEPMVRPHIASGRLVHKQVEGPKRVITSHYAWRQGNAHPGMALTWWLHQLASPKTRRALLDLHEGLLL